MSSHKNFENTISAMTVIEKRLVKAVIGSFLFSSLSTLIMMDTRFLRSFLFFTDMMGTIAGVASIIVGYLFSERIVQFHNLIPWIIWGMLLLSMTSIYWFYELATGLNSNCFWFNMLGTASFFVALTLFTVVLQQEKMNAQ